MVDTVGVVSMVGQVGTAGIVGTWEYATDCIHASYRQHPYPTSPYGANY